MVPLFAALVILAINAYFGLHIIRRGVIFVDLAFAQIAALGSFEAFLLELLSDFQISIPELGTVRAAEPPIVIISSNRTREVHDALRRRCLYHWVGYPEPAAEAKILRPLWVEPST